MRRPRRLFQTDRAEVGVGTLIVFIAMVLVAAVAAAVIIGTSGTLQQRAQTTGKEATHEVSSNIKVLGVQGTRNDTSSNIYTVKLHLTLSAGATDIDLDDVVLRYADGSTVRNYKSTGTYTFSTSWIRGTGDDNVMQPGDFVELSFSRVDAEISPRSDFEVLLVPDSGNEVYLGIRTPATFGDETIIRIQ